MNQYITRYPAAEGGLSVIGPRYLGVNWGVDKGASTGCLGTITKVYPKVSIKRSHALETDFVFGTNPTKTDIKRCVKYINKGPDDYRETLQMNTNVSKIRPITYYIRRIMAAASIIANPDLCSENDVELAKKVILEKKVIDIQMTELPWGPNEEIGFEFSDIHIADTDAESFFEEFGKSLDTENRWIWSHGTLRTMSGILKQVVGSEAIAGHVEKYSHFGAISIMIRGGFKNLLEAYLSANPPIDDFLDEMIGKLRGVGSVEAFRVLEAGSM